MIIALEGIDGSGKNTQARFIQQHFVKEKQATSLFSFPQYDSPIGVSIKRELAEPRMSPLEFQALMLADKYGAAPKIKRAARRGHVVLDRYWVSAVVYGGEDGLDTGFLVDAHAELPQPDYWILLDTPVSASVERRPDRRDHYEKNVEKLEKIRSRYLDLFTGAFLLHPRQWHVVRGDEKIEVVTQRILDIIRK